eukprot:984708-Pleurochrysis_carterae.AAC.1
MIWWSGDARWYSGCCIAVRKSNMKISYDDGAVLWHDASAETWRADAASASAHAPAQLPNL